MIKETRVKCSYPEGHKKTPSSEDSGVLLW